MESKSNFQNLLLFIVLSALILAGSTWLQMRLHPPQTPEQKPAAELNFQKPGELADLQARMVGTALSGPAMGGFGSAAQLAASADVARYLAGQDYRLPATSLAASPPPAEPRKLKRPALAKAPPAVELPPAPHKEVDIGGPDFKLQAKLTSTGGGVLQVIANQFKAADEWGRPEDRPLELVPKSASELVASNLIYHYVHPEDERPVDTLGKFEWNVDRVEKSVGSDQHDVVVFSADVPGQDIRIVKTFTLRRDEYNLGLQIAISRKSDSTQPIKFRYQITSAHGLPIEGEWYTYIFRNAMIGLQGQEAGISPTRDLQDSRSIGVKQGGEQVLKGNGKFIRYGGVANQYFGGMTVVTDRIFGDDPSESKVPFDFVQSARPTLPALDWPLNQEKPQLDDITVRMITEPLDIGGEPSVQKYLLYYGPVKVRLLGDIGASGSQGAPPEVVARYEALGLYTMTDYGRFSFWTTIIIWFTNLMHTILGGLHKIIPNYGICIILLTFLVRGLMHPVSRKQARTSIKMQALMPELKRLQERYKNDRQTLAREQMDLYRRHGVSPVGSCWVVLLQMPVFLGLYYALQESIHLRLASFVWIKNLAAPDMLIWWGQHIPLISRPDQQNMLLFGLFPNFLYLGPYFNLLPIVAVAFMIVQQKFLMPPPTDETQEMQQKMMKYMMIFFGLMFYKVAAGLCIYFIVSSVWGLAERKLLPKAQTAVVPGGGAAGGRGGPSDRQGPRGPKPRPSRNGQSNGFLANFKKMWQELLEQARKK
jgi:YidC/Oxa1 family membrane protein insertase